MVESSRIAELLRQLDERSVVVPEPLVQHILKTTGYNCTDERLLKLVAFAAQHFLMKVVADAKELHLLRKKGMTKKAMEAQGLDPAALHRTVLTSEDLADALQDWGIRARRPAYYVDPAGRTDGQ